MIRIADYLQETKTPEEIEAIKERCRTWTTNTAGLNELNVIHQACPLLEGDQGGHGGVCSVYPHRPIPCRGYHSMDVAACQRGYEHPEDKSFFIPVFGFQLAAEVSLGLDQALRERGLQSRVVLAPALLSALEDPDAASKWMAGDQRAFST